MTASCNPSWKCYRLSQTSISLSNWHGAKIYPVDFWRDSFYFFSRSNIVNATLLYRFNRKRYMTDNIQCPLFYLIQRSVNRFSHRILCYKICTHSHTFSFYPYFHFIAHWDVEKKFTLYKPLNKQQCFKSWRGGYIRKAWLPALVVL